MHTQIEAITTHLHPTLPCTIPIHVNLKAAALAESEELRSSLDATNALLIKAMAAATEQETAAAEAVAAKQKVLDAQNHLLCKAVEHWDIMSAHQTQLLIWLLL